MHTQTHRHFVAVPLACLLLTLAAGVHAVLPASSAALTGSTSAHEATVIAAGDMRRTVDIGWRLKGILEPRSSLGIEDETHITFLAGEAILSVPGYAVLDLGDDRSLVLLDATVWVRRDGSDRTVVPLDAPAVLRGPDGLSIIPPAQQRRVGVRDMVSPVPTDWLAQRIADAASFAGPVVGADADASSSPSDPASLAALLHSQFLLSGDIRSLLSFSREIDRSGLLSGLIAYRLGFDPASYDEEAGPLLSDALRLSPLAREGLKLLPALVRMQPKPVGSWLVEDWSEGMMKQGIDDPAPTIATLRSFADLPLALRSAGYPLQSDKWNAVLTRTQQTLLPLLTGEELASLDAATGADHPAPLFSSSSSVSARPRYTEKQLFTLTRQMLADHGVLMGSVTHLLPLAGPPQAVRVVGIFIAEDGRDVPYEFVFDPAAHVLSRIIRDGTEQPNAVPVDVFFRQ